MFKFIMTPVMMFQNWWSGMAYAKRAFADGRIPSYARSGLGLIKPEAKVHSKPANWVQISHAPSSVPLGRCFVLADASTQQSRQLVDDLSLIGYDVDLCTDRDTVMGTFRSEADNCRWSLLVADLDYLTLTFDLEDILYDLLSLRESIKGLSVIVVSNEFGRDDNGLSRLSVADVSLRAPVSLKRLRRGISDAKANNVIWQNRLLDMVGRSA